MFTDGHGEAADDLKPDSEFLKALNAGPRRAGVRYTIILGDHHVLVERVSASDATSFIDRMRTIGSWVSTARMIRRTSSAIRSG